MYWLGLGWLVMSITTLKRSHRPEVAILRDLPCCSPDEFVGQLVSDCATIVRTPDSLTGKSARLLAIDI